MHEASNQEGELRRGSAVMLVVTLALPTFFATYAVAFYFSVHELRADSRMYPQALILLLAILLVAEVFSDVRAWNADGDTRGMRALWWSWRQSVYALALTVAFVLAVPRIGFYESTVLYLLVLLPAIGIRRPVAVLVFTAASLVVLYGLFTALLGVRLPSGVLGL